MAAPGPWRSEPAAYAPYAPAPRPPAHARAHPYAAPGVQRYSLYDQPMQSAPMPGFYNPALPQPRPVSPPSTVGAAPSFPQPRLGLPPSLVPGRRSMYAVSRSHSNDLFFENSGFHLPPRHAQTAPAPVPPVPRKPDFDQPPLPPKVPLPSPPASSQPHAPRSPPALPMSPPHVLDSPYTHTSPEPTPSAPSFSLVQQHDEQDLVLNRVLEMSAQETRSPRGEGILTEDEQLARALEESLRTSNGPSPSRQLSNITSSPEQSPSSLPAPSTSASDPSGPSGSSSRRASKRFRPHSLADQISADEALARQLAEEEERIMQEEEEERRRDATGPQSQSPQVSPSLPDKAPPPVEADPLPQYDDAVASPSAASSPSAGFYNSSVTAHLAVQNPDPDPSGHSHRASLGRSISEKPAPPKSKTPPEQGRPVSRSQSCDPAPSPTAGPAKVKHVHKDSSTPPGGSSSTSGAEIVSNTSYLDAELLHGLAMNFGTPPISPSLTPFSGAMPNVIALPYGRTLPFYIKSPSWRNLLKLMARLGGTRVEPTMEAMAVVKTEMRLRVVVAFVKVHHASNDWHTVLYMTVDHPVPPNAPTGWKYRNGDTGTLPWSYTLSQLPAFLRDGADAPLSKFYTIPASQEAPYPVLPISFPSLATYLATALEMSRDAMHDSSSGVRRLAKYIDTFYPYDRPTLDDPPERGGVRQRLRNLVGMGSRPQRDRNAEMYELVTPFVPDEFGH